MTIGRMHVRLALVLALAALGAGCGGGGKTAGEAASLVPADALAYVTIDTDLGSDQLKSASSILDKFPIKAKLLRQIRSSLAKDGADLDAIKSSLGPEVDVAVLNVNGRTEAVALTRPRDEKTFDAQLAKGSNPAVHAKVDGWTVFSDKQDAIDAVKSRKGSLGDDVAFQAAMKSVPGDAIARAYASTGGLQAALGSAAGTLGAAGTALGSIAKAKWIAAALTSENGAFKLEVHMNRGGGSTPPAGSGLAGQIPSGSIVALSLTGGARAVPPSVKQQAAGLSSTLGFDLGGLLDAFSGPVIAYVKAGLPIPEVTIAAKPSRPARTAKAVAGLIARLAHGAAAPVRTPVEGGTLEKVDLGSIALYYGVSHGELVVTDSPNALTELRSSSGRLSDDSVFQEAKNGAGMPDTSQGFLYVDLKDAVPAIEGFAQLANQKVPPGIDANLRPLRSLLVYGARDGGLQSFVVYLKTS